MWDIINKVLDAVMPSIIAELKQLAGNKDRKRRAEIAAFASQLFIALSEILIQAKSIEGTIEVYIDRMSRHMAQGDDPYALTFGRIVQSNLDKQINSLIIFRNLITRYDREMSVLIGGTYVSLRVVTDAKQGILTQLSRALRKQNFPVSDYHITDINPAPYINHKGNFPQLVPLDKDWNDDIFDSIKAYRDSGDIKNKIYEMESLLNNLRQQIGDTFSTEEMLLAIQTRG